MAESVLLIQKDNSKDELKRFIKRFNQATDGDFSKLTSHGCTQQTDSCLYWDFTQGDIEYKLEYHGELEAYVLYEV